MSSIFVNFWRKRFLTLMPAFVLTQFPVKDQWDRPVAWESFKNVPKVLVFGGKKAALLAKDWGIYLQKTYNNGFEPSPEHLQTLKSDEKVKVIAVATLPSVPGIFKGLFRSGFRGEVPQMGMALDFSAELSSAFDYNDSQEKPAIAIIGPGLVAQSDKIFIGAPDDKKVQADIKARLKQYLQEE